MQYAILIKSPEHSTAVQGRLFEMGRRWGIGGQKAQHTDRKKLWFSDNPRTTLSYSEADYVNDDPCKIVTLDDLYGPIFTFTPVEVKLNDSYSAFVYKDKIVVGGEEYPLGVVEKLVAARGELGNGPGFGRGQRPIKIHGPGHCRAVMDRLTAMGKEHGWHEAGVKVDGVGWIYVGDYPQTAWDPKMNEPSSDGPILTLDDLYSDKFTGKSSVEVELEGEHKTATVTAKGVTVGCQTFPLSIIDALAEAVKKVKQDA